MANEPPSDSRVVVLRLTGSPDIEGQWREIPNRPLGLTRHHGPSTTMVATGTVEWDGDRCAEVYVPEDRLHEWQAEHDVE